MSRHFGVGIETTYGTAVVPTDFSEAMSESLQKMRENEEITTVRSNSVLTINPLNAHIEGDVELAGNFQDIGLLLKSFMGTVTSTTAGAPYTHTYPATGGTTGRSGISTTLEVKRDTTARTWRYAGTKTTGFSINASLNQSPRVNFSFVAKSEVTGLVATASYPTFDPMLAKDLTLTFDGTTMNATNLSLTCEWPVDQPYRLGSTTFSGEPQDNGPLSVEGEATLLMDDDTMTEYLKYTQNYGTDEIDIAAVITDGTHSLTLNMNKGRFVAFPVNMNGRDRLEGTVTWRSVYDTAATENIQLVLVNDDATIP